MGAFRTTWAAIGTSIEQPDQNAAIAANAEIRKYKTRADTGRSMEGLVASGHGVHSQSYRISQL